MPAGTGMQRICGADRSVAHWRRYALVLSAVTLGGWILARLLPL
jgi:hypothetical protein